MVTRRRIGGCRLKTYDDVTVALDVTAFILVGGKSTRMGTEKGLVPFRGRPMVLHTLDRLLSLGLPVTIIASGTNESLYSDFGVPVVQDVEGEKGPLGGLFTALTYCGNTRVLMLPCDMPGVPVVSLNRLLSAPYTNTILVAAHTGRLHPLVAIYPPAVMGFVLEMLGINDLRMHSLLRQFGFKSVDMSDLPADSFVNANEPHHLL